MYYICVRSRVWKQTYIKIITKLRHRVRCIYIYMLEKCYAFAMVVCDLANTLR